MSRRLVVVASLSAGVVLGLALQPWISKKIEKG